MLKLIYPASEVVGFELHGMRYHVVEDYQAYKPYEMVKFIPISMSQMEAVRVLVKKGTFTQLMAEDAAIVAMKRFYKGLGFQVHCAYTLGKPFVVSTKRGSIMILSTRGSMINLTLRSPHDTYLINRLLKEEFERNSGYVCTQSRQRVMYEKLGYTLKAISDSAGMVFVSRFNYCANPCGDTIERICKKYDLTFWECNDAVSIHTNVK